MKNLKKVLSLVLALAMAMSLMTVAFAKDASELADYDKVSHKEAVDVVAAVNVMVGDNNGNFNPTAVLDRASAAKIVAYLTLGEEAAEDLTAGGDVFTDVSASHWAAGYIEYCAAEGYIAGTGNGTFNPAGKLTGLQFGKMLLCVLGYDANTDGLTGDSWAIKASALGNVKDLYDNIDGKASANLTRENAAEMILNVLQAETVTADPGVTTTVNGVTVTTGGKPATTNKNDYLMGNLYDDPELKKITAKEDAADDFGRPAHTWKLGTDEIGTYADTAILTYAEGFDKDEVEALEDDYTFTNTVVMVNGEKTSLKYEDIYGREYVGTTVELFDVEGKDNIDVIVVIQGYLAQVTDETEDSIELTIYNPWIDNTSAKGDTAVATYDDDTKKDNDTFDKLSAAYDEDDYLIVYTDKAADDGKVIGFEDVAVVTGTVSTVKITDATSCTGYFTIDNTKYTLASAYNEQALKAGNEYNFFLDANGYVIGAEVVKEAAATLDEIYYVADAWSIIEKDTYNKDVTTNYAQLVALNGTVSVVVLETAQTDKAGQLVTISDKKWTSADGKTTYKADNDKFDLAAWNNDDFDALRVVAYSGWNFEKDTTRIVSGNTTYRFNSNTNYILIDGADSDLEATVKVGGIALTGNKTMSGWVITEDGKTTAQYVIIAGNTISEGSTFSSDLVYISSASEEKGDGYRVQTVYGTDGKETTLNVDEDEYAQNGAFKGAGFYATDTNDDGYVVLDKETTTVASGVWKDSDGILTGVQYISVYEDLLTVTNVEDINVAGAAFADIHDTDDKDQYNKTVGSLAALTALADKTGYTTNATLALNVSEDGTVTIFVTNLTHVKNA